jgi:pimeloyl-ACP methyl ester carboxylesterase
VGGGRRLRVVLLHGIAGHGGEWSRTAAALRDRFDVLAPDLPGHGGDAFSLDAPAVLVGQSYGGLLAIRLAADRDVRALVVVEASPSDGDTAWVAEVGDTLRAWPRQFRDRAAAVAYFQARGFDPDVWIAGLDESLRPRWDADDLERRLRRAVERATWEVWERIACPILVVRGSAGSLSAGVAAEMAARNPRARVVAIDGGHDVHLDAPEEWVGVLRAWLGQALPSACPSTPHSGNGPGSFTLRSAKFDRTSATLGSLSSVPNISRS